MEKKGAMASLISALRNELPLVPVGSPGVLKLAVERVGADQVEALSDRDEENSSAPRNTHLPQLAQSTWAQIYNKVCVEKSRSVHFAALHSLGGDQRNRRDDAEPAESWCPKTLGKCLSPFSQADIPREQLRWKMLASVCWTS